MRVKIKPKVFQRIPSFFLEGFDSETTYDVIGRMDKCFLIVHPETKWIKEVYPDNCIYVDGKLS